MSVLKKIWEAIKNLFSGEKLSSATKSYDTKSALSSDMLQALQLWDDMWRGKAPWTGGENNVKSLHIERDVCREFAYTVTNEMTVTISDSKLQVSFDRAIRNLVEELQEGLASGAFIIKPLGDDRVQYVSQFDFIPIEYDSTKRLTAVIFPDCRKVGNLYYTRLEYHKLVGDVLTIRNRAYVSSTASDLGRETDLSAIDDWATLLPVVTYKGVKHPIYGYYRNPIKNVIDGSGAGVSIYDSATDKIQLADIQAERLDWEFKSGERKLHVDIQALNPSKDGVKQLDKRLYRGIDIQQGDAKDLFQEFSPSFRQNDLIAGLEEYKREIEYSVGLSVGDLSNANTVERTATEMRISKQRKYNTVTAIQKNLADCLEDLCYGLAFFSAKANSGYEFACTFSDSILTDAEAERQQDIADLSNNIMRPEEYRAKYYGEDIETALKNLPDPNEVMP